MNKAILQRYKASVPYSQNLNNWLIEWAQDKNIVYTDVNFEFTPTTFQEMREEYLKTNVLTIWTGACNNTIYGDPEINLLARAWHDWTHFNYNLSFEPLDEVQVGILQMKELPQDWLFEKLLVHIDVIGQVMYYQQNGKFPDNQRLFTLNSL